jgi:hypothetical protein
MAYGTDVYDTSNQLMFSTTRKTLVFGGSSVDTDVSNPERVTRGGTVCQPYMVFSASQGGFIDFRIEDTSLLPNTSDAGLQLALVPFFSGPRPVGSAMVYKANRSGCTMAYYNNDGFTANAGAGVSAIVVRIDGPWPSGSGDFANSTGYAPASITYPPPPQSETLRARPCPQLMVGDVFQFTPGGGAPQTYGNTWGQTTYQGVGSQYTVQSITRVTGTINDYSVVFSPQRASAPPQYSILAVSANLNKVFVRAFIQNSGASADNSSVVGPLAGNWNMYYFREIKNSDAGSGRYGMNVFDASGNLTFTTNRRGFDIAAMGVSNAISLITPNNTTTPVAGSATTTGFFTTANKNWEFGATPANYAVYAPIAGACQSSHQQSLTPGTGRLTSTGSAGVSQGVETGVTLWPSPSSTSQFCPAKVGPPNWGATVAVTTNGYAFPCSLVVPQGSYIMVINTDKYQP